nr:hypothetical protein Iba_chr04aCG10190 [Ipomoea batatas]
MDYLLKFHCIKSQKEMSLASSLHSLLGMLEKLLHMETHSKRRCFYSSVLAILQRENPVGIRMDQHKGLLHWLL